MYTEMIWFFSSFKLSHLQFLFPLHVIQVLLNQNIQDHFIACVHQKANNI